MRIHGRFVCTRPNPQSLAGQSPPWCRCSWWQNINISSNYDLMIKFSSQPSPPGRDRHVDGALKSSGKPVFRKPLLLIQTFRGLEVPHLQTVWDKTISQKKTNIQLFMTHDNWITLLDVGHTNPIKWFWLSTRRVSWVEEAGAWLAEKQEKQEKTEKSAMGERVMEGMRV